MSNPTGPIVGPNDPESAYHESLSARVKALEDAPSGASVPSTDYATWVRTAPFETNFSFDWTADQTHVDPGGWIVLDTSEEWADPDVGASGHVAPMTSADGLYQFVARMTGPSLTQAGDYAQAEMRLQLEDINGIQITDGLTNLLQVRLSEVFPSPLDLWMVLPVTMRLPAGTHFEFVTRTRAVLNAVPDDSNSAFVLRAAIKRVG